VSSSQSSVKSGRAMLTRSDRLVCERDFLISMIPEAAIDRFPVLKRITESSKESESRKNK